LTILSRFLKVRLMTEVNVRVGAILGLIGSVLLLVVGLSGIAMLRVVYSGVSDYPYFLGYITSGTTIAWSAIGLYGVVKMYREEEIGKKILLIAAVVGIIATFIPIYFYDTGYGYIQTYYLSGTFVYIDLVLMLVGGILSFALAGKKER
jgi:peptidoglycan/LPS O-acetylase OafA/YrhL